ncbi:MAG: TonB-dependent receptor [Bacteroidetes bacterium]|jgi:iron complex outermembrane receptor protein|nr:TonB-dependent receptor [Bacteroidota bacterium]
MYAQDCSFSLSGKITDQDNGELLEFSVLHIKEINVSITTNEKGLYTFGNLCKGNYTLLITHFGCEDTTIYVSIEKNTKLNIKMPHSFNELSEVDIVEKSVLNPTQTLEKVEQEDIDKAKGKTLADALKGNSGITSLNTGATISKPMIHGLQGYRILILNNGIRQEGQQWGNEHAPEIDPFMAKNISIVKGAASVRYGSDAIAGAILLESDDLPDTASVTGEVNLVGFTNGRAGVASGILQGNFDRLKGFAWRVQGTLKRSGDMATPEYYLKNTSTAEKNFSYTLGYHRKKFGAEFFYSQFNTSIGVFSSSHIGNLSDLQAAFNSAKPQDSLASFSYTIGRPYQDIAHELIKTKVHVHTGLRSRLYITGAWQYNIRKEYDKHKPKNLLNYDSTKADLDYRITSKTLDLMWEHDNIRSFRGMFGASYMNQMNVYLGRFLIPNFVNNTWGAFAIERFVRHRYELEVGVRYDEKYLHSYYYLSNVLQSPFLKWKNVSANSGANVKFSKDLNWLTNISTAWRAPAVNELYSNGLHHGTASIEKGDTNIRMERCYSFISTLSMRKKFLDADVSVYSNYFDGFIYLQPGSTPELTIKGAFPVFYYRQTDALISGLDYKFTARLHKQVSLQLKGMFIRSQDLTNNTWISLMPSDRAEASLKYSFRDSKLTKKTYIGTGLQYVNKQWRVPQNGDYAAAPEAYYLVGMDASTTLQLGKQEITIAISLSNLTNKKYRDYLDRLRYYSDAVGRNIQFRLNIPLIIYDKKN